MTRNNDLLLAWMETEIHQALTELLDRKGPISYDLEGWSLIAGAIEPVMESVVNKIEAMPECDSKCNFPQ